MRRSAGRASPRGVDFLAPLGLLVFVDAQIASIGIEHVLRWWYVIGGGSLLAAGYIAAQRDESLAWRKGLNRGLRQALWIELLLGVSAIAVALLHHLIQLGPNVLLVAASAYAVVQMWSSVGAVVAWRTLRRTNAATMGEGAVLETPLTEATTAQSAPNDR